MSTVPIQIVVAAFQDEQAADHVADALKDAKKAGQLSYKNLAVVSKDPEGKVKIKESGDMSFGPGAGIGAVVGFIILFQDILTIELSCVARYYHHLIKATNVPFRRTMPILRLKNSLNVII